MLNYSIAIATRNRPQALQLSIPSMLSQSRLPAQIIVVDSSTDHSATRKVLESALGGFDGSVVICESAPGLVLQRNIALRHVREAVVFFPDDDSIWYPGVAEEKMKIYELDTRGAISAVCGAEEIVPPADFPETASSAYQVRKSDKVRSSVAPWRYKIEHKLFPDPARLLGKKYIKESSAPGWLVTHNAVLVEWMTGFRMSFRTDAIKSSGFDENFSGYSLFEDVDASFAVWSKGLVVGARNAKIYHHKSPERRESGRKLGVTQILNKAYVVAKHAKERSAFKSSMRVFANFKIMQYLIGARDSFARDRLLGAIAAKKYIAELFECEQGDLAKTYALAVKKCLDESGRKR